MNEILFLESELLLVIHVQTKFCDHEKTTKQSFLEENLTPDN